MIRAARELAAGWQLWGTSAGAAPAPTAPPPGAVAATVPGTVAQALNLPLSGNPDLDGQDWWYQCRIVVGPGEELRFEGLATRAEVWVNTECALRTENSFRAYTVAVPPGEHTLSLCFRALTPVLKQRRPRPRWRTALVEEQNLRWVRTALIGRIPGWTPPLPAVGPWRSVWLGPPGVRVNQLDARLPEDVPRLVLDAEAHGDWSTAQLTVGGVAVPVVVESIEGVVRLQAAAALPGLAPWWPHTHGAPARHEVVLELEGPAGTHRQSLGRVGFREIELSDEGGKRVLRVNGQRVFARGACWTVADVRSHDGSAELTHAAVAQAAAAGMNMLRVSGTAPWASDALLEACSEAGVLLWQDIPFANMDYPFGSDAFRAEVDAELAHQLTRLAGQPCVAVLCGGSEIEQQAAMLGLGAAEAEIPYLQKELPARLAGAPFAYVANTPTGGVLPFHPSEGLTHYYGVGAYLRPMADVRAAGVSFTPECLGFANVPSEAAVAALREGPLLPPHHPAWKAGVPRDNGAGWDFDDVRDHYLRQLFGVDPVALRSVDLPRYYALSRAVSGEVMLRTYAEWRRPDSGCGGALVWFFRDLVPGAGWGVVASDGEPKAAWWALRRAFSSRAVLLTDEGLSGIAVHVHNEAPEALAGTVEITLLKGRHRTAQAQAPVTLPAWSAATLSADAILGRFTDINWAYRFGPPAHDVVLVRLLGESGELLHQDALFPAGHSVPMQEVSVLEASASASGGCIALTLATTAFLHTVTVQAPGWRALDDDAFHLAPGAPRTLRYAPIGEPRPFKAYVSALNLEGSATVRGSIAG